MSCLCLWGLGVAVSCCVPAGFVGQRQGMLCRVAMLNINEQAQCHADYAKCDAVALGNKDAIAASRLDRMTTCAAQHTDSELGCGLLVSATRNVRFVT